MRAALDGTATGFASAQGDADFSASTDSVRAEGAGRGVVYLGMSIAVARQLSMAVDQCVEGCVECNAAAVEAFDEGVALYVGSLEGKDGSGEGVLLHALADEQCAVFKT